MNSLLNTDNSKLAIGVFGGTFDPVHVGHLCVAREAFTALGLDELRWVPAAQPPLREAPVASATQRAEMLALALQHEPGFVLDRRELERGGISYTVDTLQSLRAERPDAMLCLLIGQDQFASFERWHRWQEILDLCHLAVLNRPGVPPAPLPGWAVSRVCAGREWRVQPAGRLVLLAVRPRDISATRIRALLAVGQSAEAWLPPAVNAYIQHYHIYGPRGRD